jgi:hypothetical protein
MAKKVNAKAKADIDPNFRKQIVALRTQAAAEKEARLAGQQTAWMVPDKGEWNGDLFDREGMAKAFQRDKANEHFVEATKEGESPGVTGDLITTTLQIDYLAVMGRAFCTRHTSRRPRAMAHAMGRKGGHGNNNGTLTQAVLDYIRLTIQQSKDGGEAT